MAEAAVPTNLRNLLTRVSAVRPSLSLQLPNAPNVELQEQVFNFTGQLILSDDASKIQAENYSTLQNLRYTPLGLRSVQGYSAITAAPVAQPLLRNGIQFVKDIDGSPTTYLLTYSYNSGSTVAYVYLGSTAPPTPGNVSTLLTSASVVTLGRFALVPDGCVVFANGVDTLIWGSAHHRVARVVFYDQLLLATGVRQDVTTRLTNTLSDTPNVAAIPRDTNSHAAILIGATRPLQGLNVTLIVPNATAATASVFYWTSSGWTAVASLSDGTSVGGKTFARSGTLSWTSTVTTAGQKVEDDTVLYYYQLLLGTGGEVFDAGVTLSHITLDAPIQPLVDLWDGVQRGTGHAETNRNGVWADFSVEVSESSTAAVPIGMEIGQLDTLANGHYIEVMFEERATAMVLRMLPALVNSTASTLTVSYWNGTTWATLTTTDGTAQGGATLAQSGIVSWTAPSDTLEFPRQAHGVTGWFYRLTVSAQLSGAAEADIILDTLHAFTAPRRLGPCLFPWRHKNRVMLAGDTIHNKLNTVQYSATDQPDVYNGDDSSARSKELVFGGQEKLTAAVEIFNRFAGQLTSFSVVCKGHETWVLTGSTPEDFQILPVSSSLGCPCPLSLDVADVSFAVDQQSVRTVALWVSAKGPVLFDGGVIVAIPGLEPYFDPQDSRAVNPNALENVRGWYDSQHNEYNVLLPSGSGQTTCNAWFAYDLQRRRWFEKVPSVYPQMVMRVHATSGKPYIYAGIDTGHVLRLEDGLTWNGDAITCTLVTGGINPTRSLWDVTLVRAVAMVVKTGGDETWTIGYLEDGATTPVTLGSALATASTRYEKTTLRTNLEALEHRFVFSTTVGTVAPEPLGWGILWRTVRRDD